MRSFDFEFALQQCCGDRTRAHRLLSRFAERVGVDCAEIRRAAEAGQAQEASRLAHRMKGSAAALAAHSVRATAAQVEKHAAAGDLDRTLTLLADLEQASSAFAADVRTLTVAAKE